MGMGLRDFINNWPRNYGVLEGVDEWFKNSAESKSTRPSQLRLGPAESSQGPSPSWSRPGFFEFIHFSSFF